MRNHRITAVALAAALGVGLLTGCGSEKKQGCDSQFVYYYGSMYHYGSPTGPVVPDSKLPKDAKKVDGYKAPKTDKGGKVNLNKDPKPAPKPAPKGR